MSFRLPEACSSLEPKCRELAREYLSRGKLDCTLRIVNEGDEIGNGVNVDLLQSLNKDLETVNEHVATNQEVSALDILRWPGVVEKTYSLETGKADEILDLFVTGIAELESVRKREGQDIYGVFLEKLQSIQSMLEHIKTLAQNQSTHVQAKLEQRISKLGVQIDAERLAVEVAMMAQRADVDEEIDRLHIHLEEFQKRLEEDGAHGRRLNFLVQEISREANTLSTKMVVPECINMTVDLKVAVDQIREQVQNIE